MAAEYDQVRDRPGLLKVQLTYGEPAWLVTRYAEARFVLGDLRFSRAESARHDEPRQSEGTRNSGILSMDPPDHTRLRTLVAKAFTVRQVEKLRPQVKELTRELLDELEAAGPPADLVDRYALPIPVAVICRLLGVPTEDRPQFRVWSDAALSTSSLTAEEFDANREELRAYMAKLIDQHRQEPQDDLMTALIDAREVDVERLTELELIDLCVGILVAGHETTATQIPNFVLALLDHPEQLALLREQPELIGGAVEELLRFVPLGSGAGQARYATEDIEVGGTLVRAGEPVLVAVGAANRDALRFDAPGKLDIRRTGNQHLGFGHGVHHCLGAPLARLELQEALLALLTRFPDLHLAGDVEWKTQMLVRGPRVLPVGW
nr:cytochrome P450 [Streptomyces sp. SID8354]